MPDLRVGTYNLRDGGLDNGSPERLRRQLAMLAAEELDVLGLQELKGLEAHGWELLYDAEDTLGMRSFLVKSAHHGCHLATFLRPSRVRVLRERHEHGPYWHALVGLQCLIDGQHEVDIANVHLAPGRPGFRKLEAESVGAWAKGARSRGVIVVGDFNAAPIDHETTDDAGGKLDRRAALELAQAKLIDVGARWGIARRPWGMTGRERRPSCATGSSSGCRARRSPTMR